MLKKAFAVLLAFVLLASVFPVNVMAADDEPQEEPQFTEIRTVEELYKVNLNLAGNYRLMNDIDLTEATAQGGDWDFGGRGWEPIGSNGNYGKHPFCGIFDGNGYEVKGMNIYIVSTGSGYVDNLPSGITDVNELYLGLFTANSGTIKNLTVSGRINGFGYIRYAGGIVGINGFGYIRYAGGIVGINCGGTIEGCVNKCNLTLKSASRYSHYWSGLAGTSSGGLISKCYNAGNISISAGSDCSGGYSASGITYDRATINNCYNTGNITSNVSYYYYADNAYAFGISRYGTVSKCYNIGTISAFADNTYAIAPKGTDCYFLVGKGKDAAGIKSLTPAQMKKQFMYIGFDFDNTWFIADDESYPYPQLRSNPQGQYELTGLELEDAEIDVGESKALQLECVPDYATVLRKITWTSSDESVATVDDSGTVTAVKIGEATITATAENGISATCTVKVLVPITELSFGSESLTVPVGTKQKLGFTVLPADTTDTYEFTSTDTETVSVDASGNITAKKVGTAEITVTTSRGLTASCTVTVNNPATSVTLSESIKKLFAGKSFTLSARVYPNGTTDALTWCSSDNEVAVVDQNGVVTAVSAGKANITAAADSGASASCEVTVESDINKTTVVMEYRETQYDGTEKKPAVTVYYNGALLIEDADYSLTYENNTNAGEASVTIASLHDETEVVRKFNINPLSVRALSLLFHSSMVYTGSPLNAIEEITYQSLLLTEGTDYTLEYKDNTNAGNASVTVTGMGNFIGTMTKSFTIIPKPIDETTVVLDTSVFMYDGTEKTPTVTVMDGERVLEAGADYRLTYSDNISAGNASVTVEGVDNYAGSKTVNFRIEPKSILDAKVTLHSTVLAYDGTEKRPEVRVEDNGVVLTKDVDYYLDYKNNVEAGTASVNVVGMGSYYGTIATEFEIIKIGDVNMNGQVEIQDVTVLQRHLAEFVNADGSPIIDEADEEMLKIADVNRDGIVTIFDVTTIQRYLAEMIDL